MKLKGGVAVTNVKVIFKFGYDQINVSYRNVLLKNMSNLSKFSSCEKRAKLNDLIFIINGDIFL